MIYKPKQKTLVSLWFGKCEYEWYKDSMVYYLDDRKTDVLEYSIEDWWRISLSIHDDYQWQLCTYIKPSSIRDIKTLIRILT